MVLKNSPSLQNCLYSTSFIQLPFLYTSNPSDLANQLCTLRRRLSQREAEKRNARMSVLRNLSFFVWKMSHCSLKNLKKKTKHISKTGKLWVFFFNSCNFETGEVCIITVFPYTAQPPENLDSQNAPPFPRWPHHWSQFPNTTTKLDGRCTEGNRPFPQNIGKIVQPIPYHGTGIFTYIWLLFMVNVGKSTIHGWYGQQNSESTKVAIQIVKKIDLVLTYYIYRVLSPSLQKGSHISCFESGDFRSRWLEISER